MLLIHTFERANYCGCHTFERANYCGCHPCARSNFAFFDAVTLSKSLGSSPRAASKSARLTGAPPACMATELTKRSIFTAERPAVIITMSEISCGSKLYNEKELEDAVQAVKDRQAAREAAGTVQAKGKAKAENDIKKAADAKKQKKGHGQ